jgi:hypothetical protein
VLTTTKNKNRRIEKRKYRMSNENYDKVVEECKGYLKEFEVCGLKEEVLRRISVFGRHLP